MSSQTYEVVGMTLEQAREVAELLGGGAVLFRKGHSWPTYHCVVRPTGCQCHQCVAPNKRRTQAPPDHEFDANGVCVWCPATSPETKA